MKNKKIFIPSLVLLILSSLGFSQGIVRGKITDENGEPLGGATVYLKTQITIGTMSDFDGKYTLNIPGSGPQTIVASFVSYQKVEEIVEAVTGDITILDFSLVPVSVSLEETVIVGKAKKSKDYFMEKIQIKSPVTLNYISAETIKKIGDTNVSSAVARVSGVSTNGSFISVRGIGDRYMKTAINGLRIPTLDPFTNNIKLDMFPASLVDNIILVKTASPDLPGDWAGAYLSVETREFPDELSINVETSFGYNDQSTFKDLVSSERSSTDWLGFDSGTRDIDHSDYLPVYPSPSTYQEFVALGLGDFYSSMGVTQNSWKNDGSDLSKTYTKLGLTELGFLDKNNFNNPEAYTEAINAFNSSDEKRLAFGIINSPGIDMQNTLFPDNWRTSTHKAPMSYSQSFSIGDQVKLFGNPLGYLAGFRYSSSMIYDPEYTSHKYDREVQPLGQEEWIIVYDTIMQKSSRETNGWSALFNLAYKFDNNHSVSLIFMPNLIGVNSVRDGYIYDRLINFEPVAEGFNVRQSKYYEERKQFIYQVRTEHFFPAHRLKIEMISSYTDGHSKIPGFTAIRPGSASDYRFFRYLDENIFDSRLIADLPLGETTEKGTAKLKFGGAYQYYSRDNAQYAYEFMGGFFHLTGHVDDELNRYYQRFNYPSNRSIGNSDIKALFAMIDYPISKAIRFSGGIRAEQSGIFSDIALYDSLGIPANDLRRVEIQLPLNPGQSEGINYLPSGNLVIKLKNNDDAPINLRLNFSQTVARPSVREISSYTTYDNELKANVGGNPDLKTVLINNYDLRFEAFFKTGDNISLSLFHKDFKNHIEFFNYGSGFDGVGMRWQNSPFNSYLNGLELEGRKKIFNRFEIRTNLSLVDSRSKMDLSFTNQYGSYTPGDTVSHTMLGQAPYILNVMLSYDSDKSGLAAALSYNLQGPRLVIVGIFEEPNVYEMPRNLLDFRIAKDIGKHFSLSLKIQDILKSVNRRTYYFDEHYYSRGYLLDYDSYSWGTSYVIGVSYKL